MSIEALNWANEQQAATSTAQFVLEKLAWWASPTGVVLYLDPDYVAKKTRLSRASVFRHLADFEEAGILTRTRTKNEEGSPQHGAILHLEKRLSYEPKPSEKPESAAEVPPIESHHETPVSPCDSENESHHETPVSPCDSDQSHGETPSYLENLSKKNLSLSAAEPSATREREKIASPENQKSDDEESDTEEAGERRWQKFSLAYPFTTSMPRTPAKKALSGLPIKDQMAAIRWASNYREACRRDNRRLPMEAERWLRSREFDEIAKVQQGAAEHAGLKAPPVFVVKASRAWDAWRTALVAERWKKFPHLSRGRSPTQASDDDMPEFRRPRWVEEKRAYGNYFPTLFPPPIAPATASTGPPGVQQVEETVEF